MMTTELIIALQEMLERHGDQDVHAVFGAGYGCWLVRGVFEDKFGDLMLDASDDSESARRMWELPDDRVAGPEGSRGEN